MEFSAICHQADKRYCFALEKGKFLFRIAVKKGDMDRIILHCQDKYIPLHKKDTRAKAEMQRVASDCFHDYFEAVIEFDVICLRYFFELTDKQGQTAYFGNCEFYEDEITDIDRMFDCPQNLREEEIFHVPEWVENKVVYQIFPSRFASSKSVPATEWYQAPIGNAADLHGDLRGVIEHLEHMRELGIDVLYMTPIFLSESSHKYDTMNYYRIDPSFGTEEDLKELVEKAHAMGMRVVLDGVFNHTSPKFFAFADIQEKGEMSKYKDWYYIDSFPPQAGREKKPNYKCFAYYGGMPKLNLQNPETAEYFIRVGKYWIEKCGIDGWRLDVGDEISHSFWKKYRTAIKELKPEALLVGEIWHFAGDFLEGDEWDSVMNYSFFLSVKKLVADESISVSQFVESLDYLRGNLNSRAYPVLWNLIDSHDTARFLHICGEKKEKLRLAAALQLLLPGMPMIYYGDEYGMTGCNDSDCRRGMLWDETRQDLETYAWYRKLIHIRKKYPVLVEGREVQRWCDDENGVLVLRKEHAGSEIALIIHAKDGEAEIFSHADFIGCRNVLDEADFDGKLGAYEVAVLELPLPIQTENSDIKCE